MADDPNFLARWSRRKHASARGVADPVPPPVAAPAPAPVTATAPASAPAPLEPPPLPPVESLTIESDFAPFMAEKVDEGMKRAALRKLFSDPHFNVMDGLDIYIDDYTKPDPMPEGLLDRLAGVYETVEDKLAQAAARDPEAVTVAALEPGVEQAAEANTEPPTGSHSAPELAAEPEPQPSLSSAERKPDERIG